MLRTAVIIVVFVSLFWLFLLRFYCDTPEKEAGDGNRESGKTISQGTTHRSVNDREGARHTLIPYDGEGERQEEKNKLKSSNWSG